MLSGIFVGIICGFVLYWAGLIYYTVFKTIDRNDTAGRLVVALVLFGVLALFTLERIQTFGVPFVLSAIISFAFTWVKFESGDPPSSE